MGVGRPQADHPGGYHLDDGWMTRGDTKERWDNVKWLVHFTRVNDTNLEARWNWEIDDLIKSNTDTMYLHCARLDNKQLAMNRP